MDRSNEWERTWKALRDPLTWSLGAGLLIYESVIRHGTDQGLLIVIGGLLGFPVIVRYEERRERQQGNGEE